ncbi:MAG: M16 family metallopeptidase [bacterium]
MVLITVLYLLNAITPPSSNTKGPEQLLVAAAPIESCIGEFTLNNGLHVIHYFDSSAPVVSVNVYYQVGSYDEPPGITGISHMVEHMSFKHTDIYKPGDFDRMLDSVGANNNGFTSTYYTGYYEVLAKKHWELALKMEAARMHRCVFPDSEFASEHQVVAEERRLQDNRPTSVFWEQFEAVAFLAHPHRNPTIGWADDVEKFTVEKVREWYKKHYNPANAVLVIAGDVRLEEVKPKVEKYFGRIKGESVPRKNFYNIEPPLTGERRLILRKHINVPRLLIAFPTPGNRDSLYIVGDVVASILGQGRKSRLYRTLIIDSALATSVSAWNSVERDPGLLEIMVTPKDESLIPKIENVINAELKNMATELVSDHELQRVKNQTIAASLFERDDISDIAWLLATSQINAGDWRDFLLQMERIEKTTTSQVRAFCRKYLTEQRRIVGILVSDKEAR